MNSITMCFSMIIFTKVIHLGLCWNSSVRRLCDLCKNICVVAVCSELAVSCCVSVACSSVAVTTTTTALCYLFEALIKVSSVSCGPQLVST